MILMINVDIMCGPILKGKFYQLTLKHSGIELHESCFWKEERMYLCNPDLHFGMLYAMGKYYGM